MYKAIKDNKIIAISENDNIFFCMIKDEVIEDIDHNVEDYVQYNGEYILKEEQPLPTQEEQQTSRQNSYIEEADPLKYDYEEAVARYGSNSEYTESIKQQWLSKKDEIRERYPYPIEPTESCKKQANKTRGK